MWPMMPEFFVKIQRIQDTESQNKASTKRIQKNEGHSQPGPYKPRISEASSTGKIRYITVHREQ